MCAPGLPNYLDPDSDNDGVDDSLERVRDVDLDGTPEFLDISSAASDDKDTDGYNPWADDAFEHCLSPIPDPHGRWSARPMGVFNIVRPCTITAHHVQFGHACASNNM